MSPCSLINILFFFFNDTATTEIYTLSLHDALPICPAPAWSRWPRSPASGPTGRSEEHTSELQSHVNLVCRLLLEKKTNNIKRPHDRKHSFQTLEQLFNVRYY